MIQACAYRCKNVTTFSLVWTEEVYLIAMTVLPEEKKPSLALLLSKHIAIAHMGLILNGGMLLTLHTTEEVSDSFATIAWFDLEAVFLYEVIVCTASWYLHVGRHPQIITTHAIEHLNSVWERSIISKHYYCDMSSYSILQLHYTYVYNYTSPKRGGKEKTSSPTTSSQAFFLHWPVHLLPVNKVDESLLMITNLVLMSY